MTALALRDDQDHWEPAQLAVLRSTGIDEKVTEAELMAFLHECQQRKLDPFTRQIYFIGRWNKALKRKVYRSQTGIDGFRVIARRAADDAKIEYSYEDTIWFDRAGQPYEVWLSPEAPVAAKVVVVRNGSRYDAVARYGSYVQTDDNGNPTGQWRTMPEVMIAKCAEALALRKAFPEDLGGIYTDDEMGQADNPEQPIRATAEVIRDEPAQRNGGSRPQRPAVASGNGNGETLFQQLLTEAANLRTDAAGVRVKGRATAAAKKNQISIEQEQRVHARADRTLARLREDAGEAVDVEDLASKAEAEHAQDAAEDTQESAEDALPVEDPPDWPETVRPGTGTPKGR